MASDIMLLDVFRIEKKEEWGMIWKENLFCMERKKNRKGRTIQNCSKTMQVEPQYFFQICVWNKTEDKSLSLYGM